MWIYLYYLRNYFEFFIILIKKDELVSSFFYFLFSFFAYNILGDFMSRRIVIDASHGGSDSGIVDYSSTFRTKSKSYHY